MNSVKTFPKTPAEDLDYGFDLTEWLTAGEEVVSVDAAVEPAASVTLANTGTDGFIIRTYASGGTLGTKPRVSLTAETDSVPPRTFQRSITLAIQNR